MEAENFLFGHSDPIAHNASVTSESPIASRVRRSASVGSLPSLEQIRAWSEKRNGTSSGALALSAQKTIDRAMIRHLDASGQARQPVIQVVGASPPRVVSPTVRLAHLASILAGSPARQRASSAPSSPERASFFGLGPDRNHKDPNRTFRAEQMVSVLERRRSFSIVH